MTLDDREWLETDGLGGWASGTASGVRTRRQHAILTVATTPPVGRMVLVNGFDAWAELGGVRVPLSTHRYAPDVLHPDGAERIERFLHDPWPTWRYRLSDALELVHELFIPRYTSRAVLRWRLVGDAAPVTLFVRPLLSGRAAEALHCENAAFDFTPRVVDEGVIEWTPYVGVPGIRSRANADYLHRPDWYRRFAYAADRSAGLAHLEDLATPGTYRWDLTAGEAVWIVEATTVVDGAEPAQDLLARVRKSELERRTVYPSSLHQSASHYIVRRNDDYTILADYPEAGDRARDACLATRGLCLATGRVTTARRILLEWTDVLSEGMLPTSFPSANVPAEYDSADASLWLVIAIHDLLLHAEMCRAVTDAQRRRLQRVVAEVVRHYAQGTRLGIRCDTDGLLMAGEPGTATDRGTAATWMNARVDGVPVTPRVGKPVELQALWLNALAIAGRESEEWRRVFEKGLQSFRQKFWNAERGSLHDVVDVDHVPGTADSRLRPNQIFAVGGLPVPLITGAKARSVVDGVERGLLTPLGLRTLGPGEPGYRPSAANDAVSLARAAHQGGVWPSLLGPFVDAWVRAHDGTRQARAEARQQFVQPMIGEIERLGCGHLPAWTDAEAPFTPRGVPFSAISLAELLRVLQ